jgi:hypothetical protein
MISTCPEIGVWRAWLDHETDVTDLEQHLAQCPACQRLVADLRGDAGIAQDLLSRLAPTHLPDAGEVAMARERLTWRRAGTLRRVANGANRNSPLESLPMALTHISTPWRIAAGGLAAAVALSLIVAFTPQGASTAAAFLATFRPQQVAAITITPQSQAEIYKSLNALGNLGTIETPGGASTPARPQAVARAVGGEPKPATLAEAAQTVGNAYFLLPDAASLPAGVNRTPQVRVVPGSQFRFTFDKKKAQAYYQANGHPELSLPDKFDGASLIVTIPSAAILEYSSTGTSKADLIIGEAGQLEVDVQGNVSLDEMRDFLLGLPGLPADVVSKLKEIKNWTDTLPIPVPVDQIQWHSVTIDGAPGLLLDDNSGVGSAAIWHANNHMYGIAGTLNARDLKPIADTLAVR